MCVYIYFQSLFLFILYNFFFLHILEGKSRPTQQVKPTSPVTFPGMNTFIHSKLSATVENLELA